jgi:hypothetical protein
LNDIDIKLIGGLDVPLIDSNASGFMPIAGLTIPGLEILILPGASLSRRSVVLKRLKTSLSSLIRGRLLSAGDFWSFMAISNFSNMI